MLKVTLFLQRNTGSENDDVIRMYEDDEHRDMIRVVYSTPELKRDSTFYLPTTKAMVYVSDLLKTLYHDSQPFESIQVSSSLHPSILYDVVDLGCCGVRHLIEDTVEAALHQAVFRTRRTE